MEECVYFTRRAVDNGKVMCWVFKGSCPKCKKGMMGKPVDDKTGKVKVRAADYVCPECRYSVPKQEYEDTLTANADYTCPHCGNKGQTQFPFKRKTFMGVKALVFDCEKCKGKIPVTKKMAEGKSKKSKEAVPEDFE